MIQGLQRLPKFTITRVESADSKMASGIFDSVIRLGEGWISYLIGQEGSCMEGRFYRFDVNTKTAIFQPKEMKHIELLGPGKIFSYLDGYWGERVALVLDTSRQWKRKLFKSQDADEYIIEDKKVRRRIGQSMIFPVEEEGRKVSEGWDHEHCAICWETISESKQPYGYADQNGEWVCESCYSNFVQPKNLGFLNEVAISQIQGEQ